MGRVYVLSAVEGKADIGRSGTVMICQAHQVGGVSCIYTTSPEPPTSLFRHDARTRAIGCHWSLFGDGLWGFCKCVFCIIMIFIYFKL